MKEMVWQIMQTKACIPNAPNAKIMSTINWKIPSKIPLSTKMLNGWNKIDNHFRRAFHCPLNLRKLDTKLRKIYLMYLILPNIICTFLIFVKMWTVKFQYDRGILLGIFQFIV